MKVLVAGVVLASMQVAAAGAVIDPPQLGASRAAVEAELSRARQADPTSFATMAKLREKSPELAALLKRVSARDVWPAVELIAFEAPSRGKLGDAAWRSLQVSLLEAAGMGRDARAAPVFEAVLRTEGLPFELYRAATDALDPNGPRRGTSRRVQVEQVLATALGTHPGNARAKDVIRGLSDLGATWDGKAPVSDEDVQVRDAAAKAVLGAYVSYDGDVRQEATKALESLDAPHTELLIENQKLQGVAVPELDRLERKLRPTVDELAAPRHLEASTPELAPLEPRSR